MCTYANGGGGHLLRRHIVSWITFMVASLHSQHPLLRAAYSLVCHCRHRPQFFLALDPSYVPPRSVIIASIAIVPIEEYDD
jgi:hypothetical protein